MDKGIPTPEELRQQLEDLGNQQYNPLNWFGDRAAQLEEQRHALRRRIADSYQFEGAGIPQRPPTQVPSPLRRALGGWIHPLSQKHVPAGQYGFTRHPSSVPGPSVGGGDAGTGGGGEGMAGGGLVKRLLSGLYKEAGPEVSGMVVRKEIPNLGSLESTFNNYETLPGVREVPMSYFGFKNSEGARSLPGVTKYITQDREDRVKDLARQIQESQEISPLVVAHGREGPYVVEGGHRFDALKELGAESFPAVVAREKFADGGSIIQNIPQNELLGALSGVARGVDEFTKPARDIPYAGALVPSFESLGKVLEDASYGMPLMTGKGLAGTLNLKPDVGFAALDATQLSGVGKLGKTVGKTVGKAVGKLRPRSIDPVEAMFGSGKEWEEAHRAWNAAHGYAGGGLVKGALSRIAKMIGADELPKGTRALEAVKEQGGQWMPGAAQEFVDTSIRPGGGMAEISPHEAWARKQIPKYVEKYMGAKGDPLADVRIPFGGAQSRWEEITDPLVNVRSAGLATRPSMNYEGKPKQIPEWMSKLDPNTPLYGVAGGNSHGKAAVEDYISHVMDHASTIPPEKLKNYDFPRLVQEVQKIDAERAKKMSSVEGNMEGTVPYKEYPEGFKWVEVQSPKALRNEGDIMGHCVGGYCDDVNAGRKKIYSLRDPKGESHVTVEAIPHTSHSDVTDEMVARNLTPEEGNRFAKMVDRKGNSWSSYDLHEVLGKNSDQRLKEINSAIDLQEPLNVNQIKGKQNLAPKPEYQKYVQDLIKSGNYGEVRDIQNSGLRKSTDVFGPAELETLKAQGKDVGAYLSQGEISDLKAAFPDSEYTRSLGNPQIGMKKGGSVNHKMGGSCRCLGCAKKRFAEGGSVTPELLDAVRHVESRGNSRAVSPKGAQGSMQFMPATAKELGIDPFDPKQAREGAGRYLNWLIKQTGSLKDALAAYNWGIGNVKKYGTDNLPKETKNYVDKVLALLGKQDAGQQTTVASAPVNAADTTPQPDVAGEGTPDVAEAGAAAGTPPMVGGGGSGTMPRMAGYGRISGPMPGSIGTRNPQDMVQEILKDPLNLSRMS